MPICVELVESLPEWCDICGFHNILWQSVSVLNSMLTEEMPLNIEMQSLDLKLHTVSSCTTTVKLWQKELLGLSLCQTLSYKFQWGHLPVSSYITLWVGVHWDAVQVNMKFCFIGGLVNPQNGGPRLRKCNKILCYFVTLLFWLLPIGLGLGLVYLSSDVDSLGYCTPGARFQNFLRFS